ncbi:hypothetical protein [Mucilaginibacter sp. L3T2-6]|uniref:hypothetical protein n=1 Tax=Mucilaginibacter sp. L3T2-6 TaxID=3062491 RepID=UPI0026748CF2|nr:hypothetical protein [Mucilaginibacter sp. L3T2-6]MDO3641184.1 hypothetical protein [Mucilaginibacter sp. L3T2-6]MDV6213340.1 hypothetical protein [Mucilaginibacter sp. L3T2-6]
MRKDADAMLSVSRRTINPVDCKLCLNISFADCAADKSYTGTVGDTKHHVSA